MDLKLQARYILLTNFIILIFLRLFKVRKVHSRQINHYYASHCIRKTYCFYKHIILRMSRVNAFIYSFLIGIFNLKSDLRLF